MFWHLFSIRNEIYYGVLFFFICDLMCTMVIVKMKILACSKQLRRNFRFVINLETNFLNSTFKLFYFQTGWTDNDRKTKFLLAFLEILALQNVFFIDVFYSDLCSIVCGCSIVCHKIYAIIRK